MIENALLTCKNDFIFKELDKADLAACSCLRAITVNAGAQIITQDADGDYCYVVDSGSAHVVVNGKDVGFSRLIMTTIGECSGTKH